MLLRTLFLFLLVSSFSNFAQDHSSQLTQNDFMGKWKIYSSAFGPSSMHIIRLNHTDRHIHKMIHFFKGEYTGKRRINTFSTKTPRTRRRSLRKEFSIDYGFFYQSIWEYDAITSVLIIKHARYDLSRKYKVTRLNLNEFILERMD